MLFIRYIVIFFIAFSFIVSPKDVEAKKIKLKIATLAPEGSTWWKIFRRADKRLKELSKGKISIKLYASGVAGDEHDIVRSMRIGKLHGAALTSVGLAQIQPALLVLQAPGLFENWDELSYVRDKMSDKFSNLLADKGYHVMLWGDVGFNRFFSQIPVKTPIDIAKTKPWCWTEDGVYQTFYKSINVKPVLVGVPEVLPGLQTGLLNSYFTPPLISVSLQWFNRSKYMLDIPINVTIGAVVLTKKKMDKLSDEDKAIIAQVVSEIEPQLTRLVRKDNSLAMETIRKKGISITTPDAKTLKVWKDVANKVAMDATNSVYPKELLVEVQKIIQKYRSKNK